MDQNHVNQLTKRQYEWAYQIWMGTYLHAEKDELVLQVLQWKKVMPEKGWLNYTREGFRVSSKQMAQKLGISKQSYLSIEKSEQQGRVNMRNFLRAIEALDCELVYAVRPKSKQPYSKIIWDRVAPEALKNPWILRGLNNEHFAPRRLSAIVRLLLEKPEFRRRQNFSERGREYFWSR